MGDMDAPRRSLSLTFARVLAIAFALGVLAWLVVRAQRDANQGSSPPPPAVPASDAANDPTRITTLPASKAGVIEPMHANEDPSLLFGSKSAPVPEGRQATVPVKPDPALLPSSKFGPLPGRAKPQSPAKQQ
jgi:hypothetical protein